MTVFIAAIGATVSAIFELTVGPYLRVGDAQPHFVLIFAIIWTVAVGLEAGLAGAFVGGLVLDVLAPRPLGATAFVLVLCVGLAATITRLFPRVRPLLVAPLVGLVSLVYSMTLFFLLGALGSSIDSKDPVAILTPGVVYDTVVAVLIGPLVVALHDRRVGEERPTW